MKKLKLIAAVLLFGGVLLAGCSAKQAEIPKEEVGSCELGDAMTEDDGNQEILYQAAESSTGSGTTIVDGGVPLAGAPGAGGGFDRGKEEDVIRLVNNERSKNGLGPVSLDESMMNAAEVRAQEQMSLFSHTRPDGSSAFTVFAQFGIPADYRGENVAYAGDVYGSDGIMGLWMNSDAHRQNILNGNFGRIGVGYFEAAGIGYWCQLFAN